MLRCITIAPFERLNGIYAEASMAKKKKSGTGLLKEKISAKNLRRLCQDHATQDRVLVIHSEDIDYKPYFPNAYTVTKAQSSQADMHTDDYYTDLAKLPGGSYDFILCTGLLEHVPDPPRLLSDLHRILKPGGKLVISASAVFSFHEGPNNFFHFTPYGFKLLFKDWSEIDIRGSSQPFETIAILMQRILLQCEIKSGLVHTFVELLCMALPKLDRYIGKQYTNVSRKLRNAETEIDSMLPSNVQAVVIK
jgi:SAM-dependent methyltransferase